MHFAARAASSKRGPKNTQYTKKATQYTKKVTQCTKKVTQYTKKPTQYTKKVTQYTKKVTQYTNIVFTLAEYGTVQYCTVRHGTRLHSKKHAPFARLGSSDKSGAV